MNITGNIVGVLQRRIYKAELQIRDDKIFKINFLGEEDSSFPYILPGFIDAHVHIESTMVTPVYFAEHVKQFGTVGVVTDPHEISNVCGVAGFEYMYNEAKNSPIGIYFGVPSCVPATPFETSGAVFDANVIKKIFENYEVVALSEMMNFPGVINKFDDVISKLDVAKSFNKKIDGHAPGLTGDKLSSYINSGISTDHEAFSYDEAREKINKGMKIQIREGSAARNFSALHKLISEYPDKVMFCTDDAHPDTLIKGHIDRIVKMAIENEHDVFNVLQAASVNAIQHYNLPIGLLNVSDTADFIVVDNLRNFKIQKSYFRGKLIYAAKNNERFIKPDNVINQFDVNPITVEDIQIAARGKEVKIIEAIDGELITNRFTAFLPEKNGFLQADPESDILKLVVVNRYKKGIKPQVGFIRGFSLKNAAMASSVAHDSHNIIVVGDNDEDIINSVNAIIDSEGGVCVSSNQMIDSIPLPVAGLMANETIDNMAFKYFNLEQKVKQFGSTLQAPFMTLAFMSLLVIPSLKLGDKGLFDVDRFEFTDLYV